MTRKALPLLLILLIIASASLTVSAQKWRSLGSEEVGDNIDHDTIAVTAMKGDFRRVKLVVTNAPIRIYRMVITYGNGATQEVALRSFIRAGGETRAINLRGKERVIRKVDFWYETASLRRQKARVELFGRD